MCSNESDSNGSRSTSGSVTDDSVRSRPDSIASGSSNVSAASVQLDLTLPIQATTPIALGEMVTPTTPTYPSGSIEFGSSDATETPLNPEEETSPRPAKSRARSCSSEGISIKRARTTDTSTNSVITDEILLSSENLPEVGGSTQQRPSATGRETTGEPTTQPEVQEADSNAEPKEETSKKEPT